jgi:hypothetical protein
MTNKEVMQRSQHFGFGRLLMESRDIGIGIVMIIPTFVGGGALWQFFHSWSAVIAWIIVMAGLYLGILYKKSKTKGLES